MSKKISKFLIIGSNGQIGTDLSVELSKKYGVSNVILSDIREPVNKKENPFEIIDVLNKDKITEIVKKHNVDTIINLAAVLSAVGEKYPDLCWNIAIEGLRNILSVMMENDIPRLFLPSSMAAYGPTTPKENVPQHTVLEPTSIYGVTKVTGELLCNYYVHKYGLDIRGIRFPGVISHTALPGGGTTDYAVDIFYQALLYGHFECFVSEDTRLPMVYSPDCIRSIVTLIEAPFENLKNHANYNLAGLSFTAGQLVESVRKYIPNLTVDYKPDFRQAIADSWSSSIDDTASQKEWGWRLEYDLDMITRDMLERLKEQGIENVRAKYEANKKK